MVVDVPIFAKGVEHSLNWLACYLVEAVVHELYFVLHAGHSIQICCGINFAFDFLVVFPTELSLGIYKFRLKESK